MGGFVGVLFEALASQVLLGQLSQRLSVLTPHPKPQTSILKNYAAPPQVFAQHAEALWGPGKQIPAFEAEPSRLWGLGFAV